MTPNYKEVLDELREYSKGWAIISIYDVPVVKDASGEKGFDICNWEKEWYMEFGGCPEDLAIEAAKNYDMKDIDREGYWNVTHLLKPTSHDVGEGYETVMEIVHTEAQFVCTLEQRQTDESANTDLFGNAKSF